MKLTVFGTLDQRQGTPGAVPVQFNLISDDVATGLGTCVANSSTLTVTGMTFSSLTPNATIGGAIAANFPVSGAGLGPYVVAQLTGTPGGAGTYQLSAAATATQASATGFTASDIYINAPTGIPAWDASGSGVTTAGLGFPGSLGPFLPASQFAPNAGAPRNATLSRRYFPLPVQGFARDPQLGGMAPAGATISVSAAEAFALGLFGGLASW